MLISKPSFRENDIKAMLCLAKALIYIFFGGLLGCSNGGSTGIGKPLTAK
jgi:hypothetical protein